MPEILLETSAGFVFEKTVNKNNRCKVAVKHKSGSTSMTYRFRDVPGLDSQYVGWDNLNCCDGWVYDESYLHTAVQLGKKLYAGFSFSRKTDVEETISDLQNGLPEDCVLGQEEPSEHANENFTNYFICKTGTIADYISLDEVFAAYDRLGVVIDGGAVNRITELCHVPLPQFAGNSAPFQYGYAHNGVELVVTGLLLGYPLETTAYLIERSRYFPVRK
jgi:hypothetical protein